MNNLSTPYLKRLALRALEVIGALFFAFPLSGKLPLDSPSGKRLAWKALAARGAGAYGTHAMWNQATGYAVAPLPAPLPLAILDLDRPNEPLCQEAAAIVGSHTFTVSARGKHLYVRLPRPLGKAVLSVKDDAGEILSVRSHGAYAVGAGSQHAKAGLYRVDCLLPPALLTSAQMNALLDLLSPLPEPPPPPNTPPALHRALPLPAKPTNPRVIAAIERALEVWEGKPLHYSAAHTASLYCNPMRPDDEHRSAYFSRFTGMLHDKGTGKYWRTIDVCNRFGIRVSELGGLTE